MFQNRQEAGLLLSRKLKNYQGRFDAIVFAIPRGGVVVGKQIAQSLNLALSVVVVKKLGAPNNPELAIGAVSAGGVKILDHELITNLGVSEVYLKNEIDGKQKEVEKREKKYQISIRRLPDKNQIFNKTIIILVDDGIATGATTLAAIKYIKKSVKRKAKSVKIILAVPVIAKDTYDRLQSEVDELIAIEVSDSFRAVGQFYREFPQVTNEEVVRLLSNNK